MLLYTTGEFEDAYPVRTLDQALWVPRYYRRPAVDRWSVWQVTSLADVDGVPATVDLDVQRVPPR